MLNVYKHYIEKSNLLCKFAPRNFKLEHKSISNQCVKINSTVAEFAHDFMSIVCT